MARNRRFAGALAGLALLAAAAGIAPARGQDSDAAALSRVEGYLKGLQSLRADFDQEIIDGEGSVREHARGTLVLQKPGRFRWDYREPYEQQLVSDGVRVWLYDVELEQVTVREMNESLSTTPALLLSGRGDIAATFTVQAGGGTDQGLQTIVLTPKLEESDFRSVRLGFRGDDLERMELTDRLGQTARIRFSGIERNPELPAALFEFKPPPGVDVVGTVGKR